MKLTLDSLPMYCTDCSGCLLWRQGVNSMGYPQANLDGKGGQLVRRYVFTVLMGRDVPPGCVVSARCGSPICCSPDHLVAMKRGKVLELAYETGKRSGAMEYAARLDKAISEGRATLDWNKVHDIRSRPSAVPHTTLAAEFGVKPKAIAAVRRGLSWRPSPAVCSVFAWRPAA
jgi:hypothetical protein